MTSKEDLKLLDLTLKKELPESQYMIWNSVKQDLKTAEAINNKLYFLSLSYKNASKEDLLELFSLYANAFKVIEKHFDVKCFNHSNYMSCTLEIYQDNERKATTELFDSEQGTFSALCNLRWRLKNAS